MYEYRFAVNGKECGGGCYALLHSTQTQGMLSSCHALKTCSRMKNSSSEDLFLIVRLSGRDKVGTSGDKKEAIQGSLVIFIMFH